MYKNIEKFLEKYEGQVGLVIVKKYGLFFITIYYQGVGEEFPGLVADTGFPTLEEVMLNLDIQIGRGDIF